MKKFLPVVKSEVGFSIAQSLSGTDNENLAKKIKKIKKENPVVAEFIKKWSNKAKGDSKIHTAFCGILVYELLRSQAESDEMDADFFLN